jgi:TrbL/VirB6 plasmid conjugal transfer protein
MNNFDTLFPNFLNQCTEMNHVLTPIAFVLLAIGIVSSTVTGRRSPSAYLRTIGRTFAFAAVLAYLPNWSNEIATTVDSTVKNTLHADPAGVYQQYQKTLEVNKGTTGSTSGSKSWWDVLDGQALFEAGISIVLWLLGFIASVIVFYAYLVQKFILYVGYALAPIFIGFLAVRTLHSIGVGFLLGYAGVLCWPLGWGAASLLTSGLISFMTDQSFLSLGGVSGSAGYGLQNLLGLAALALWLISSTIAAPIIMQKAIATGAQVGQGLATTAFTAGSAGAAAGVGAVTTIAAGGGVAAAVAGVAGGATAAMLGAAEASITGSTHSPLGNLVSSLGGGMSRRARRPKKNDPTGDEAVRELLQRSRK